MQRQAENQYARTSPHRRLCSEAGLSIQAPVPRNLRAPIRWHWRRPPAPSPRQSRHISSFLLLCPISSQSPTSLSASSSSYVLQSPKTVPHVPAKCGRPTSALPKTSRASRYDRRERALREQRPAHAGTAVIYWPMYQPIPWRSKALVKSVSELV